MDAAINIAETAANEAETAADNAAVEADAAAAAAVAAAAVPGAAAASSAARAAAAAARAAAAAARGVATVAQLIVSTARAANPSSTRRPVPARRRHASPQPGGNLDGHRDTTPLPSNDEQVPPPQPPPTNDGGGNIPSPVPAPSGTRRPVPARRRHASPQPGDNLDGHRDTTPLSANDEQVPQPQPPPTNDEGGGNIPSPVPAPSGTRRPVQPRRHHASPQPGDNLDGRRDTTPLPSSDVGCSDDDLTQGQVPSLSHLDRSPRSNTPPPPPPPPPSPSPSNADGGGSGEGGDLDRSLPPPLPPHSSNADGGEEFILYALSSGEAFEFAHMSGFVIQMKDPENGTIKIRTPSRRAKQRDHCWPIVELDGRARVSADIWSECSGALRLKTGDQLRFKVNAERNEFILHLYRHLYKKVW